MELWPAISRTPSGNAATENKKKSKATSREAGKWTNYPVVDHGGLTASTLTRTEDSYRWKFIQSHKPSRLRQTGDPTKVFPLTRSKSITNTEFSLRQRAEQGAKYLRTYHPDVDISYELLLDELDLNDYISENRDTFDPFRGNTLSATCYFQNDKRKKGFLLAFPTGEVGRDLNISPVQIRNYSLVFHPRSQPVRSFNTPICQIVSSSPATQLITRKEHYLAVRTYGEVSVFDIKNQTVTASNPTARPISLAETLTVHNSELNEGDVMDMFLSTSASAELHVVSDKGCVYQCMQRGEHKAIQSVFNHPGDDKANFWRICTDNTPNGGIVASTKTVKRYDTRFSANTIGLLDYKDQYNVITSICPSEVEHIFCVGTTRDVLWVDDRFPAQPLLGWRHHRRFDRTLSTQCIGIGDSSLTFLSSLHNNVTTAISVNKLTNGPLETEMPSQSLPQLVHNGAIVGKAILHHPRPPGPVDSFSVFEMCDQGSIHHREFEYSRELSSDKPSEESVSFLTCQWSDDLVALDEDSKMLKSDYGKMAEREFFEMDLSGLYGFLFGEDADTSRTESEEQNPDAVYDTLDRMPSFWQHSEEADDYMHTLFDVAFGSGEEPLREARADFLTGSSLDTARGHRARKQGRLPIEGVKNKAEWHSNLLNSLKGLAPNDCNDHGDDIDTERLDPYELYREDENPVADHKETLAREQLALDLALSMDVFSSIAIKSASPRKDLDSTQATELDQEPSALLSKATEQLSLSQKKPPPVSFSYFRPVSKDGTSHYKSDVLEPEFRPGEEDKEAEMPLGVRLLLSEWTIGDDPQNYKYVDPYDLDGSEAQSQFFSQLAAERNARRRRGATEEVDDGAAQHLTQSQAPPAIIAAKSLANTQPTRPPAVARSKSQTQSMFGFSQQTERLEPASSQPPMMNTQVLPGPHGGRNVKKKPVKKRVGGF